MVTLSAKEYSELIDFKKEVEDGIKNSKIAVVISRSTFSFASHFGTTEETVKYITEDEAALDFKKATEHYQLQMEEAWTIMMKLKVEKEELKNMSLWDFIKWRKKLKEIYEPK